MKQQNNRAVIIKCPICEVEFEPLVTKTNMCANCYLQQQNITKLSHDKAVHMCRNCKRYERPPWVLCQRESKELLTICLKKIKGLDNKKIIDAKFLFTEPTSRVLSIRLDLQEQITEETSIQQSVDISFHEDYKQCDDCKREFTPHNWVATVQLRQRVEHKKSFYLLEQLIIKHHMDENLMKIESADEGINLYFKTKTHATHMVEFIKQFFPLRVQVSKEVYSFVKYTYVIDVPRVCRDDLLMIPPKLAMLLGGINPIQLCFKISSLIHLIDPITFKCSELHADKYFQYDVDIEILTLRRDGAEFTILDMENLVNRNLNESYLSSVTNQFINQLCTVDVMKNDDGDYTSHTVKSHLGHLIKVGYTFLGYDLSKQNSVFVDVSRKPEIVLVKRKAENKNKNRKLKRLDIDEAEDVKKSKKAQQQQQELKEQDFEEFANEVDADEELSKHVVLVEEQQQQ